jgi:MFS family permease
LVAGTVPAVIYFADYPTAALLTFIVFLVVSSVASAAANPAMTARASTAGGKVGRTRYLADRAIATWVGILVGTAGMTGLLVLVPGVWGYAIGFVAAAVAGLGGLRAYAGLVATDQRLSAERRATASERSLRTDDAPPSPSPVTTSPLRRTGVPSPSRSVWGLVATRLGAPSSVALGTIVVGAAVLQGGASMIGPAAPIWLVKHLGMPASYLGALSLVSSLAAIASQRVWARYIDRNGPGRVLGVAGGLAALVPLGWLVVFDPWAAVPLNLFAGLSWGGYSLAMSARLLQLAPSSERPAYLGTYAAAIGISGAVGSLVAGAVAAAVPIEWMPAIFVASFATRGLGWWAMRGGPGNA